MRKIHMANIGRERKLVHDILSLKIMYLSGMLFCCHAHVKSRQYVKWACVNIRYPRISWWIVILHIKMATKLEVSHDCWANPMGHTPNVIHQAAHEIAIQQTFSSQPRKQLHRRKPRRVQTQRCRASDGVHLYTT